MKIWLRLRLTLVLLGMLSATSGYCQYAAFDADIIYGLDKKTLLGYNREFNEGTNTAIGSSVFNITDQLRYSQIIIITNRDPDYLGATYTREGLPLFNTGRFLSGELTYNDNNFGLRVGRLVPDYHPLSVTTPFSAVYISGDGYDLSYDINALNFHTRLLALRNEKTNDGTVNRYFNYHGITLSKRSHSFTAGEFLLYTGLERPLSLVWSNPLLPYFVHNWDMHDNRSDNAISDNNNVIFYFAYKRLYHLFTVETRLYLDEFQVDITDREVYTDEFLFFNHIEIRPKRESPSILIPKQINIEFSMNSAAFGMHPGLFTSFSIEGYSFLPNHPGYKRYIITKALWQEDGWFLIGQFWTGKKKDINRVLPENWNIRDIVAEIPTKTHTGGIAEIGYLLSSNFNIIGTFDVEQKVLTTSLWLVYQR